MLVLEKMANYDCGYHKRTYTIATEDGKKKKMKYKKSALKNADKKSKEINKNETKP